jgi:hypothetical protein
VKECERKGSLRRSKRGRNRLGSEGRALWPDQSRRRSRRGWHTNSVRLRSGEGIKEPSEIFWWAEGCEHAGRRTGSGELTTTLFRSCRNKSIVCHSYENCARGTPLARSPRNRNCSSYPLPIRVPEQNHPELTGSAAENFPHSRLRYVFI